MTVIVYVPGQLGDVRQIDGSLTSMQEVVGGYIETLHLGAPPGGDPARLFVLISNEEGKLKQLPPNMIVGPHTFVGTVFIAIMTPTDIVGLTAKEVALWERHGDPHLIRL